ncbi:uncharacterized protein DS421_19g655110 [Arachis hypogaea]|uniref:Uncharacterized protein n=1 Tax=Arachis hypogaea TaxID=3818 RepID=A0A6B9V9K8_ARAHY|nr:uncharacterized protein DS421_19g655110 [Arachis hypogaea]
MGSGGVIIVMFITITRGASTSLQEQEITTIEIVITKQVYCQNCWHHPIKSITLLFLIFLFSISSFPTMSNKVIEEKGKRRDKVGNEDYDIIILCLMGKHYFLFFLFFFNGSLIDHTKSGHMLHL